MFWLHQFQILTDIHFLLQAFLFCLVVHKQRAYAECNNLRECLVCLEGAYQVEFPAFCWSGRSHKISQEY